jgi:hypothetical protein
MRDADDDDDDDEPCGTARRTRDMLLHENHTCTLQVGGAHANHLGYHSNQRDYADVCEQQNRLQIASRREKKTITLMI